MRHLKGIIAGLIIATLPGPASAQQEVILDNVTNSIGDTALVAGNSHILNIRYRSFPAGACSNSAFNVNTGFVLYSNDGAIWNRSFGTLTLDFMLLGWPQIFVNHFEDPSIGGDNGDGPNDGFSPDYLVMSGVCFCGGLCGCSMEPPFDEVVLQIEIETNLSDTGLHICIDSSSLVRLNTWIWAGIARSECNVAPDWGGPYCFTIVPPTCGDANTDGQLTDDDLTFLIQYYFSFGPPPTPGTGDVNGDGTIDITDIIYLANYLHNNGPPPCPGSGPGGFDWKDKPDTRQAGND